MLLVGGGEREGGEVRVRRISGKSVERVLCESEPELVEAGDGGLMCV